MLYTKKKNKSEHSSIFSSSKCENCGASFKPHNQYCEYCRSERPYEYPQHYEAQSIDYDFGNLTTITGTFAMYPGDANEC
jgi:hypothetical protein